MLVETVRQGACHLWCWRPDWNVPEGFPESGVRLLDAEELARYERYKARGAALIFLASRVLVRSVLSQYWDIEPSGWRFRTNFWGRPLIANEGVPRGLDFNLSNKPGFVTCLVGYGREFGVDVEDTSVPRFHLLEIASRFFSPSEYEYLQATPDNYRLSRFYELWTLKESYIKARGRGLSLGLSGFSFAVEGDTGRVRFASGFHDPLPNEWDFRLVRTEAPYLIATAIRLTGAGRPALQAQPALDIVRSALAV